MSVHLQEYQVYHEALTNPSGLAERDLLWLIDRYPYSQPLRYAWLRRQVLIGEKVINAGETLFFAPNSNWLWDYVHTPVVDPAVEVVDTSVKEAPENVLLETELERSQELLEEESDFAEPILDLEAERDEEDQDALEKLVQEGSVVSDYFIFEKKEKGEVEEIDEQKEEFVAATESTEVEEEDNVSLYNDDLMPYSFRWWLHKTRLEYADTYQPFATPVLPKPQKGQFDPQKLDEAILDQQIKENIIHFQDPEKKLSAEVISRPVEYIEPKKEHSIIEKFIREEPVIQPPSAEQLNNENMARQSAEDNYVFVTETLANIYIDQGLNQKAVAVFKKLILKYPEKKSYFASQIEKIENNLQ